MPKLYYTPHSCGAASFTAAFTAGLKWESEIVDLAAKKTASGADFYSINPKGNVPTLVLDSGYVINENVASLTYITNQVRMREVENSCVLTIFSCRVPKNSNPLPIRR